VFQGPERPRTPSLAARLGPWLRENWIYPAAAGFLVLAGVFLVQYSIEAGLLSPQLRVAMALGLGLALMMAGETIRRRAALSQMFGAFSAHLPSTFAGAGVVVVYGAIFAAHVLYDLIPATPAFAVMALVTLVAIGLGWVYGPLLAALGVLAGTASPFLLGAGGTPAPWIFGYFGVLMVLGLGIDALRRWRWVSWVALAAPLAAGTLMRLVGGDETAYAMLMVLAAALAMTTPGGALRPVAVGPMFFLRTGGRAGFATAISAQTVVAATVALVLLVPGWAGALGLAGLILLLAIWADKAPALADQAIFPILGLIAWVIMQAVFPGPVFSQFTNALPPESAMPLEAGLMLGLAVIAALGLLVRADRDSGLAAGLWAMAGLSLPGAVMVAQEVFWKPALVIEAFPWALHALALAALNTAQALRYARIDGGQGVRLGAAVASAFAMIAFGLMLILSLSALTAALAVLMVAAAAMDRRFDLPALGVFQVLASIALAYRFVVDPGILWLVDDFDPEAASIPEVLLTLLAVLGGPALALYLLRGLEGSGLRRGARLFVETGLTGMVAVAVPVVIVRLMPFDLSIHASLGLHAAVFLGLAKVQALRLERLENAKVLRKVLMLLYGLAAALLILVSVVLLTPLQGGFWGERVRGPIIFNDLLVAYAMPALALLVLFATHRLVRWSGGALLAYWAVLAIRHFWQGPEGMASSHGMMQAELYTYTVAILLGGAVALVRALQSGRPEWRKLGMGLIALATLKAFLVDASGLEGLLRVFGFLAMGLSLAALAWVNRWVMAKERGGIGSGGDTP
jgi:uncharacterized membrane protein